MDVVVKSSFTVPDCRKTSGKKDDPFSPQTKPPDPGRKKRAGEKFALSGYTNELICLHKETALLPVAALGRKKTRSFSKGKNCPWCLSVYRAV